MNPLNIILHPQPRIPVRYQATNTVSSAAHPFAQVRMPVSQLPTEVRPSGGLEGEPCYHQLGESRSSRGCARQRWIPAPDTEAEAGSNLLQASPTAHNEVLFRPQPQSRRKGFETAGSEDRPLKASSTGKDSIL
ncbi:hypothetical protein ElyMa_005770400 [Elysia marginata]|uniref:Uncharacterized protein n=1 Tax=Elysia marginata TaxID=1093978 RepID=A0AAV4FP02_9GAST|nr:hypothetical protein ElyMa_005770400 [Elysia marginata]